MINMQIVFSFAEIWGSKSKHLILYVIFLNKDISVTILHIAMIFVMRVLHFHFRGKRVSDFVCRPSFSFYMIKKIMFLIYPRSYPIFDVK